MKFSIRFTLLFALTLVLNTSFAVSSITVNPPIESTTAKQSFKEKAKEFYQKQVVKRVKKQVKQVKDSWSLYKESKKKGLGLGTTFILLLTATFVTLKILGIIMWSWLWVLAPLWIPVALFILLFLVALIGISALKN